jgi:protein phosphatase
VKLSHAEKTDVGMIRSGNEDNFAVDPPENGDHGIFIVADGMGGHAAGEVASEMAVQIVLRQIKDVTDLGDGQATRTLGEALRLANRAIHDRTITEVDKQGMGTTASVLMLADSHCSSPRTIRTSRSRWTWAT